MQFANKCSITFNIVCCKETNLIKIRYYNSCKNKKSNALAQMELERRLMGKYITIIDS